MCLTFLQCLKFVYQHDFAADKKNTDKKLKNWMFHCNLVPQKKPKIYQQLIHQNSFEKSSDQSSEIVSNRQ